MIACRRRKFGPPEDRWAGFAASLPRMDAGIVRSGGGSWWAAPFWRLQESGRAAPARGALLISTLPDDLRRMGACPGPAEGAGTGPEPPRKRDRPSDSQGDTAGGAPVAAGSGPPGLDILSRPVRHSMPPSTGRCPDPPPHPACALPPPGFIHYAACGAASGGGCRSNAPPFRQSAVPQSLLRACAAELPGPSCNSGAPLVYRTGRHGF